MKTEWLFVAVVLLSGCATTKQVSLRELREYDQAISIAESRGMDTSEMRKHLVDMMIVYMKQPGKDPYLKAIEKQTKAAQMQAFNGFIMANPGFSYQGPSNNRPMSPGEFFRGMGR